LFCHGVGKVSGRFLSNFDRPFLAFRIFA